MPRLLMVVVCLASLPLMSPVYSEEAPRIAVVNVSQVFSGYLKVPLIHATLKKMIEVRTEELKNEERRLKLEEDRLRMDPRDPKTSKELFQEIQALDLKRFEYESKYRDFLREKNEKEKSEMKSVLHDIDSAIAAVTRAEKLDLVVRGAQREDRAHPTAEPQSVEELVLRWKEGQVLIYSPKLDVTEKVITSLNEEYKKATKQP